MRSKTQIFFITVLIVLLIYLSRLFQLTIILGKENRSLADNQRLKLRNIPALRGIIYDRNHTPLVRNSPLFLECDDTLNNCQSIDQIKALTLEAKKKDLNLVTQINRDYLYGKSTAHLLGYVSLNSNIYQGTTGIEGYYDQLLKGNNGAELIEVDTQGIINRKIGIKESVSGKNLNLTIDINLQKIAYEALADKKGAVVASNPHTGEILALVSSPGFDPQNINLSLNKEDQPMFNRVISGAYPPGSTFKIITALAGLNEGKITQNTTINDTGVLTVGSYQYANWYFTQYGKTEGEINIITALKRSNDVYFYRLGEMLGAQKIIDWGKKFNLGKYSGIDLDNEATGFLPDPQTTQWFLGNTYHLAIGQGSLGLTPLQVNLMTSVIASNGKWCKPFIGIKEDKTGKIVTDCDDLEINPETIAIVKEGMKQVCQEGGTAYPLFNFQPLVACKTGTAEFGDPQGKTHAWLTAFAPADQPEITVTVLVEEGGEGSTVASPIAKKVLEEYFRQ